MDEKKLRQAITQRRTEINERISTIQEEMLPVDAASALTFYTGELTGLTWILEQLSTPDAEPFVEVGDHDIRKNRKSPKRAKVGK